MLLKEESLEVLLQNDYLDKLGLSRARMARDGNCLFRCYAQGVFSDQSLHSNVRRQLCDALDRDWEGYKEFVPNKSKREYLDYLKQDGTYGGELEILALSELYGIGTQVFHGKCVTGYWTR